MTIQTMQILKNIIKDLNNLNPKEDLIDSIEKNLNDLNSKINSKINPKDPVDHSQSVTYQIYVSIMNNIITHMYNDNKVSPEEFHVIIFKIMEIIRYKQEEKYNSSNTK